MPATSGEPSTIALTQAKFGEDQSMSAHEFRLVLANQTDLSLEETDALYEAGCDDATFGGCDGVVYGVFHRESESLEQAIRSAIADVQKAGLFVGRVEPADPVFAKINVELTAGC